MINPKDRYESENRKYRHSIKRSAVSSFFPDTIKERIKEYLIQVGYEIVSSYPELVARRTGTRDTPFHVDTFVSLNFIRDEGQTRIDIDYLAITMLPWQKVYYFAELKEIKEVITGDAPVTRKPSTKAIAVSGCFLFIFAAMVFDVGVTLAGVGCAFGIMKILPYFTPYPERHWVHAVIATFITILLFFGIFSYFYLRYRRAKVKEW